MAELLSLGGGTSLSRFVAYELTSPGQLRSWSGEAVPTVSRVEQYSTAGWPPGCWRRRYI